MDSTYYVSEMIIVDDPFDHHDYVIVADVSVDNYPTGNDDDYGRFTTGLMNTLSYPAISQTIFRRSDWVNETEHPLLNCEVIKVLDGELQNYLLRNFNATLYNRTNVALANAMVINRSKWGKFMKWIDAII